MSPSGNKTKRISICRLTGWLSRKQAGIIASQLPKEGIVFLAKRYKNVDKKRILYTIALRVSRGHKSGGEVIRVRMKSIFSELPPVHKKDGIRIA